MSLENNIKTLETTGSQPQPTTPQTDVADTSGSSSAGSVFTSDTNQPKASSSGSVFTDAKNQQPKNTNTTTTDVNEKKIKKKKDFTTQEVLDYIHSLNKSLPKDEKIKLIRKNFDIDKKDINTFLIEAERKEKIKNINDTIREDNNKIANELFEDNVSIMAYESLGHTKGDAEQIVKTRRADKVAQSKVENDPDKVLVTNDELLSPEWKNRTHEEKIDVYMDLYLARNDSKYAGLSDEGKEAYRKKEIQKINESLKDINKGIGLDNAPDDLSKSTAFSKYINILEGLNKRQITIDRFSSMNTRNQTKLIKDTTKEATLNQTIEKLNNIKNLIPEEKRNSEEWKQLDPKEKLRVYADAILTQKDPKYAKLPANQKEAYINKKINNVLEFMLGDLTPFGATNVAKEKEQLLEIAANCLESAEQGKLTEKELNANTFQVFAKNKKLDAETLDEFDTLRRNNPDVQDLNGLIKLINRDENLSKDQKQALRRTLKATEKLNSQNKIYEIEDYNKIAQQNNCENVQDFIKQKITLKTSRDEIGKMMQNISTQDAEFLAKHLEEIGFDKNEIKELSHSRVFQYGIAFANEDGTQMAEEITILHQHDPVIANRAIDYTLCKVTNVKELSNFVENSYSKNNEKLSKAVAASSNINLSTEQNIEIMRVVNNSDIIPEAGKAIAAELIIETAKNDEIRVKYSEELSKDASAPFLEGLAAGSKYVTNESAKTQYTSYIQTAASNFPPEVQKTIQTTLKTGKISQETLSKTTPPAVTDNKVSSSISKQEQNTGKTVQNSTQTPAQSQTVSGKPSAAQPSSVPAAKGSTTPNLPTGITPTISPTISPKTILNTSADKTYSPEIKTTQTSSQSTTTKAQAQAETSALEAKRDAVGEKILAYQEHVKESNVEKELKDYLSANESQIIEDVIAAKGSNSIPAEVREKFNQILAKNNINVIYDIITAKFGSSAKEKFLEALAKYGSSESVSSFANDRKNDTSVIKTLYLKCTNQMIKSELLRMLPEDAIHQMISDGVISNLNDIDTKILKTFLLKNGSIMSNSKFASYRKYFSLDDWTNILNERNTSRGINTEQKQQNEESENSQKVDSSTYAQNPMQFNQPFENSQQTKQTTDENIIPETRFKAGETIKTLSDGTVITNQGTTFAGISNNTTDDAFKIVEPKQKQEGSPIGMNDEVLTPGSEEWKRKYNKQLEPPKTAFTMNALDNEDYDDFGIPFGSNKVSMSTKINKKSPKNFRLNA